MFVQVLQMFICFIQKNFKILAYVHLFLHSAGHGIAGNAIYCLLLYYSYMQYDLLGDLI